MKRLLGVFLCLILLVTTIPAVQAGTLEIYRLLQLFGDVFSRVRAEYVEAVDDQKIIESALNGMLTSLDPHSGYMSEKEFQELRDMSKGEFGGLGVEVIMEHGVIKVISPVDDTPAFRAGVQPGDYFIEINDVPIMGMTSNEAVEKMRGTPGTMVKIKIFREGKEPYTVDMKREIIKAQPIRWRIFENIGVVRINTFINEETSAYLLSALKEIKLQLGDKFQGVILDVRNNAGGLLEQAVAVSDIFLDEKEVVSIRGRNTSQNKKFFSKPGEELPDLPVVVLTNSGTASASEIVAGALQDHKRALILGTRSFGKGSVQTVMPLSGYGAMRLTTQLYYTPSGRSIQAEGIVPDIEVSQSKIESIEPASLLREENIPGALKSLISKPKKDKEAENTALEKPLSALEQERVSKDQPTIPSVSQMSPPMTTETQKAQPQELPNPPTQPAQPAQGTQIAPTSTKEVKGVDPAKKENAGQTNPRSGIKEPSEDFQLRRALDLIHGLNVMGNLRKK